MCRCSTNRPSRFEIHRAIVLRRGVAHLRFIRYTHSFLLAAASFICGCGAEPQRTLQQPSSIDSATDGELSIAPSAPSKVVCRQPTWDFGTVDQTKTRRVSHTFLLENVSAKPVRLEKVELSCGCLAARDHPGEIPANSATDFTVEVDLAGPPRPLQKFATIHLATSPPSELILTLSGTIDASPAFYSLPGTVDFGTLRQGERRSRTVKITRFDGSPVKFVRGVSQAEAISLDGAVVRDEADSCVELTLLLDSSALRREEFASSLTVQTEHATHREFSVPIKARIAGTQDGLVAVIYTPNLRRGAAQEKALAKGQVAARIEDVSYEGKAPVVVELLQGHEATVAVVPAVRISRIDDGAPALKPKVVSGQLLVTVAGRNARVRIPMFVQLVD